MKKKLLLTLVLVCIGIFVFGALNVLAASSGTCGTNLKWTLDNNGTLTISGNGAMSTYSSSSSSSAPWYSNRTNVKTVVIKEGVTSIGSYAFYECTNLTEINIPKSVTSIAEKAFYKTGYYNNDSNWDDDVLYLDKWLVCIRSDNFDDIYNVIPGTVGICDSAFRNSTSLTEIIIPDSVENIGGYAFYECLNLKSIYVPGNVNTLGSYTFYRCENLKIINISNGVKKIGYSTFARCTSLESLTLPDSVTHIGSYAFEDCSSLKSIYIPNSVTTINMYAFLRCKSLETVIIPNGVTTIERYLFKDCSSLISVTIPNSVVKIERYAFSGTPAESGLHEWAGIIHGGQIFYNGSKSDWNRISIDEYAFMLINGKHGYTLNCFHYLSIYDEEKNILLDSVITSGLCIDFSHYTKTGHILEAYSDSNFANKFDVETPITENTELYIRYTPNKYTYKFIDDDGTTLKEVTADYGTVVNIPDLPCDKDPYTFDYWKGYTEGMTVSKNITFTAVYKYKDYSITAEGLNEPTTVTYNSSFTIAPQTKDDYHYFIGYFTEKDGKGIQITNIKGESLKVYDVVGNLTVYPHFYEGYMNVVSLHGTTSVMPGDIITVNPIFATDKAAIYLTATIKYPSYLNYVGNTNVDFEEISIDSERTVGNYKYIDITCIYDYEGNNINVNTDIIPFEMQFNVLSSAPVGNAEITLENVMLIGNDNYNITDITNYTFEIVGKLAESIEIIGENTIDKKTQFSTVVSPDYTFDKSVVWSGDNDGVALVTDDGFVTPVKNGTVTITATAKDGSGVFGIKPINIIAYAKIDSIDFGTAVCVENFNPDNRKYTVYVSTDANSITITPTFSSGGVLRPNGSGMWVSGHSKDFELGEGTTTITLNRQNVTDMTDSVYTIEVVRFEGTKTLVSDDGKTFNVSPLGIKNGNTIILALYNGKSFVQMQKEICTGEKITFTTDEIYTNAKVMVWNDLKTLIPACKTEIIE